DENSLLVGFIHFSKMYETVDIVNIVVDECLRNKGIASKLINELINYFDDVTNIMLEVNENNIPAISLYKKNKFYVINKRDNYYGNDNALIMKRDV
ncbi:MAG: GNAT family N-acetyltransferase, partial [Bacilli bacterium]|nr:GNAT family N-acetyltransferase [Bacilli bacterium]